MEHDFSKVFDTDNPMWQEVLAIFESAKDFPIKTSAGRELHHKFPRCFSKLLKETVDNDRDNLISLTPSQHCMVHYYYFKLSTGEFKARMAHALKFVIGRHDIQLSDYTEEQAKALAESYEIAKHMANNHQSSLMKGKKKSPEHCKHISEGRKGIIFSPEHCKHLSESIQKRVLTPEQRDKMRTNLGKHNVVSDELRKWRSEHFKGRKFSDETRKKMSDAAKRLLESPDGERIRQQRIDSLRKYRETHPMISATKTPRPPDEICQPILEQLNRNEITVHAACKALNMSYDVFHRIFKDDVDPNRRTHGVCHTTNHPKTQKPPEEVWQPVLRRMVNHEITYNMAYKELNMSISTFSLLFRDDIKRMRNEKPIDWDSVIALWKSKEITLKEARERLHLKRKRFQSLLKIHNPELQ